MRLISEISGQRNDELDQVILNTGSAIHTQTSFLSFGFLYHRSNPSTSIRVISSFTCVSIFDVAHVARNEHSNYTARFTKIISTFPSSRGTSAFSAISPAIVGVSYFQNANQSATVGPFSVRTFFRSHINGQIKNNLDTLSKKGKLRARHSSTALSFFWSVRAKAVL